MLNNYDSVGGIVVFREQHLRVVAVLLQQRG